MATTDWGSNKIKPPGAKSGTSPYDDDIGTGLFNFGGKSPIEYIQFLSGPEIFSLFGDVMLNSAFEEAYKTVAEFVSDSVILENLNGALNHVCTDNSIINAPGFSTDKRILRALRQNTINETTTQHYYPCRKISYGLDNSLNPYSIHYENDPFDPVWYISDDGGIKIAPGNYTVDTLVEPVGKVYFLTYPKFGIGKEIDSYVTHDLGESSGRQNLSLIGAVDEDKIFIGLPQEAREAIYIHTALNLCTGYLSNHVQDDEDTELVALLNQQVDFFNKKLTVEMQRIAGQLGAKNE